MYIFQSLPVFILHRMDDMDEMEAMDAIDAMDNGPQYTPGQHPRPSSPPCPLRP
ncbi:MAG: hypothetical protein GY859_06595 [Desulfobacterales bacterium]|nr:hypothetical protein [Desulfobacterales bacterium]